MVLCAYLADPEQKFQMKMADMAENIAVKYNKNVWIDGGISYDLYEQLKKDCPDIYAVVMGRGVYGDKELFRKRYGG